MRAAGWSSPRAIGWVGAALAATVCLVAPAEAEPRKTPTRDEKQHAVDLHDDARALYEKGEYRAAIAKLEEALALDPHAKELVYNLGVLHEKLGDLDDAERYFVRYVELERDPKAKERAEATLKRIQGAKHDLAEKRAAAAAAPAPPPSAPAPPPAKGGPSRWIWVSGGVAIAGAAAGTVFGISAVATQPGADARTGKGVGFADLEAQASSAHTRAVIADVCFGVAIVAGGATAYLALSHRGDAQVALTARGAYARLAF